MISAMENSLLFFDEPFGARFNLCPAQPRRLSVFAR
jgi:hypothetical protein